MSTLCRGTLSILASCPSPFAKAELSQFPKSLEIIFPGLPLVKFFSLPGSSPEGHLRRDLRGDGACLSGHNPYRTAHNPLPACLACQELRNAADKIRFDGKKNLPGKASDDAQSETIALPPEPFMSSKAHESGAPRKRRKISTPSFRICSIADLTAFWSTGSVRVLVEGCPPSRACATPPVNAASSSWDPGGAWRPEPRCARPEH